MKNMDEKIFNKKKKKYHHKNFRNLIKATLKIILMIVITILVVALLGVFTVYQILRPKLQEAQRQSTVILESISDSTFALVGNTVILDCNDNIIDQINSSGFVYAPIEDISPYITKGYVAVEDKNFYKHKGIDYKAILRATVALYNNNGEITQGGSTITQQLLKINVLGYIDDKWDRKMVEFFLAPKFEKRYSKDKILEFYCNTIFYSNNCYGVGAASRFYFGKNVSDLTPAEAAVLIGLSNNPAAYNPINHYDDCIKKRNEVLEAMYLNQVITEEQYNGAIAETPNFVYQRIETGLQNYATSFAVHCLALKLMEQDGFNFRYTFSSEEECEEYKEKYSKAYSEKSSLIRSGGYTIHTTLNMDYQNKLQEIVDSNLSGFTETQDDGRYALQGSATLIDNSTGMVVAIVGGRGKTDEYNRAFQAYRQPGSSIKPVIDYAPAFDKLNYFPSTLISDLKDENDKAYPSNWDGRYVGRQSIRESIARSVNTVAYKTLQDVGVNVGLSYLSDLKFSGLDYWDTNNGSLAIGGFTYGTTTFEMSKAYNAFYNEGKYTDGNCIREVEYTKGDETKTIFTYEESLRQVYKSETAAMITECLKDVLTKSYATGTRMRMTDVEAAGKTGTSNDNKDGWFCGFTPAFTMACWTGYDYPKTVPGLSEGIYAGRIWKDMQTYLYSLNTELPKELVMPSCIVLGRVNSGGDYIPNTATTESTSSWNMNVFPLSYTNKIDNGSESQDSSNYSNQNEFYSNYDENEINHTINDGFNQVDEPHDSDNDVNEAEPDETDSSNEDAETEYDMPETVKNLLGDTAATSDTSNHSMTDNDIADTQNQQIVNNDISDNSDNGSSTGQDTLTESSLNSGW